MKKKRIHFTEADIIQTLEALGLQKGNHIFIHSNIGFFGRLEHAQAPEDYYAIFKRAIFKVIGEEGTVVHPAFSYSFCKNQKFDLENTPGIGGVFAEMARKDPDSVRSADANFSVVAIGKHANFFTANAPEYSFGKNSFWERFLQKNGKFVNFNFDAASTFIHYVEKQLGVPYRYDKAFKGKMIVEGKSIEKSFFHFVYDMEKPEHVAFFSKFDRKAKQMGLAKTANLGRGQIVSITAKNAFELIEKELPSNPSFLIQGDQVFPEIKTELNHYFDRLFPIHRSLTGDGNRKTLQILSKLVDIEVKEIPSGTTCFDWTVPPEWNIKEAWIKDGNGNKIIDIANHNLHLLGYSEPFHGKLSYEELKPHLYSLADQPDLIPYLTSYYKRRWGFCLSHDQLLSLDTSQTYEVFIDSSLDEGGSLTIGEAIIKGESEKEILFSTYICHPSLASNELSGPLVTSFIYKKLKELSKIKPLKYTYRFLFVPETIGSIYMLSKMGNYWKQHLQAGFIITCIGDDGPFTYKRSRLGEALPDRVAELILNQTEENYNIVDFFPSGSDERQYCSPGFNLPVGSLMRSMYAEYPEYHTSADNKAYISFEAMEKSVNKYLDIIEVIEKNEKYVNTMPYCEPQLGKRGLYPTLGSQKGTRDAVAAMMWVLNLADGEHDLISIAERSKVPVKQLIAAIDKLIENGILKGEG